MTNEDRAILSEYLYEELNSEETATLFSLDKLKDENFILEELKEAQTSQDTDYIELIISLTCEQWKEIEWGKLRDEIVEELNKLLLDPNHYCHQRLAKFLQDYVKSPSTIPYIRKVLESNFDYLEYTCSENGTIAKWFSWLLYAIGTDEAFDLMKEYTICPDNGISNEMKYRLERVRENRAIE